MKDHYLNVPGWFNCPNLYLEAIQRYDDAHFVEVGSWKGRSASFMAENIKASGKSIRFDCVDTWLGTVNESHHMLDPDVVAGKLLEVFHKNLSPFVGYYNAVQAESLKAAQKYDDQSLDFVYIDASHLYADVKNDIEAWLPKVKKGGIISGDDYNSAEVARAVREMLPQHVKHNRYTWVCYL